MHAYYPKMTLNKDRTSNRRTVIEITLIPKNWKLL